MRWLHSLASATGSVYKIVFTSLLIYEVVRYQFKRKQHVQGVDYRPRDSSYRNLGPLGPKKKGRT